MIRILGAMASAGGAFWDAPAVMNVHVLLNAPGKELRRMRPKTAPVNARR